MGKIKRHFPVKFFFAVTFNKQINLDQIKQLIESEFDGIDLQSEIFSFDPFTNYYANEMGTGLKKVFISQLGLKDPSLLPGFKIKSNQLEQNHCQGGSRQLNLDPGYLTEAKVILATTKDYSHRIYLDQGIFGDLHLFFEKGSFRARAWTYPDYKQDLVINFFNKLRKQLRSQMPEYSH